MLAICISTITEHLVVPVQPIILIASLNVINLVLSPKLIGGSSA